MLTCKQVAELIGANHGDLVAQEKNGDELIQVFYSDGRDWSNPGEKFIQEFSSRTANGIWKIYHARSMQSVFEPDYFTGDIWNKEKTNPKLVELFETFGNPLTLVTPTEVEEL